MTLRTTGNAGQVAEATNLSADQIRAQLMKITQSPEFRKANRLREFLRFVVEEKLAGRVDDLKAYTIALEVFGRPESFDPVTDTVVRVTAGKLRRALERYYFGSGVHDTIVIEIPKGKYAPLFHKRELVAGADFSSVSRPGYKHAYISWQPTIAVLPFINRSQDAQQQYFAQGLSEELTSELCRFDGLQVIAYCSTRSFADKDKEICELGQDLDADFLLTGSVNKSKNRFRVNVQLHQTRTGQVLWAQRFERHLTTKSLFEIQDDIVRRVVTSVADDFGIIPQVLVKASRNREVADLSAYEAILRFHHFVVTLTAEAFEEARRALEHAVEVEPDFALAWAMLSLIYLDSFVFGFAKIDNALEQGTQLAHKSVLLDPNCQYAHHAKAFASLLKRDRESIIHSAKRIIELNPNAAFMVGTAGWWLAIAGQFESGLSFLKQSFEMNPFYPAWFHLAPYLYHFKEGDYESAFSEALKFDMPDFFWTPLLSAAALGQLRRLKEAEKAYQEILHLRRDFADRARHYLSIFVLMDDLVDGMLEGLHKAGLPQLQNN